MNFKLSFLASIVFTIAGVYMKLNNVTGSDYILAIGIIATLTYMIIGIWEVNKSKKLRDGQKVMWTIGFIALNFFAGLLYLTSGRKRIITEK